MHDYRIIEKGDGDGDRRIFIPQKKEVTHTRIGPLGNWITLKPLCTNLEEAQKVIDNDVEIIHQYTPKQKQ